MDGGLGSIALLFPCGNLLDQSLLVQVSWPGYGDSRQASQSRELDLRNVEPAAVLGGVVELQAVGDSLRLLQTESFVQQGTCGGERTPSTSFAGVLTVS